MSTQSEIEALMHQYIAAVQSIDWEAELHRLRLLDGYPVNCCSIASFHLGHLLRDRGYGEWSMINGYKDEMGRRHDWLESIELDLVVDATPHQFPALGFTEPFVLAGRSPLEEHFPRQGDPIELARWNDYHQRAYELVLTAMQAATPPLLPQQGLPQA